MVQNVLGDDMTWGQRQKLNKILVKDQLVVSGSYQKQRQNQTNEAVKVGRIIMEMMRDHTDTNNSVPHMKVYTGLVGELHTFSASALVRHEWPAHGPSALPVKKLLLMSMGYKVVCIPQHIWIWWEREKFLSMPEWNPSQSFYRERASDQEKCLQKLMNEAIWTYSTHLPIAKYNHHRWTFVHYTRACSIL
jgi:hypothetical protein